MSREADLVEALELALKYWADRQQRYRNRCPVWVSVARAALARYRASAEGGETGDEVKKLAADLTAMTKDRDSWKREFELYANAWLRSLGGKIFNKRHRIDALVMTTKWLAEGRDEWERETARMKDERRLRDLAATLGASPEFALASQEPRP